MIIADTPAIVLAPMEGLTDAPMREVQGRLGAFTYSVAEFFRISGNVPSRSAFYRSVPELRRGARTNGGLSVQVQLLGGHPGRMGESALNACLAGAKAIDINFGCPAPTVNNHDGGASLLKYPKRIREIVAAVREAVPAEIPVSAKLRLGWDTTDAIFENAAMAAEGGASWLTIHARTREQGYRPPVRWEPLRIVRENLNIPIVANGDIWTMDEFRRCREETGCLHFMLGRGALGNPSLSHHIAGELGIIVREGVAPSLPEDGVLDWRPYLQQLIQVIEAEPGRPSRYLVRRIKQWLKIADLCGNFAGFDAIKRAESVEEIFAGLGLLYNAPERDEAELRLDREAKWP